MIKKIFINFILFFSIVILQFSFVKVLPSPVNNLNIILTFLILVTIINYKKALYFAVFFGIVSDIYSLRGFGISLLSYLFLVLAVNFLYNNVFTNRSIISLATLCMLGTLVNVFSINILSQIYFYLKIEFFSPRISIPLFINLFWQIIFNSVFLIFSYLFLKRYIKR